MSDDILGSESNADAQFARPKVPMASEPHKLPESAFDRLRRYPDGFKLKLTTAGSYPQYPVEGRICHQAGKSKVVVFMGSATWLELTAQSDVEFCGEHHLHVH